MNTKGLHLYEWEHFTELLSKSQMRDHPRSTCLYLGPQAGFFFLVLVLVWFGFAITLLVLKCHSLMPRAQL